MARFVLVHGAFGGAWCWDRVTPGLRAAGHDVEAIDLNPAHPSGADATPVGEVTLAAYGERVCQALAAGPPAVLVGHSMGGMAVTQAAARRPDLIAGLVYAAAFLPVEGESLISLSQRPEAGEDQVQANLVVSGDPPVATMSAEGAMQATCQLATAEQAAWADAHRGPQPVLPFTQPLELDAGAADAFAALPRAYVMCLQDRAIWPDLQRFMAARAGCDPVLEIDTDHSVWLTAPDELVAALLALAPALLERRGVETAP
jgi:pimeloyl-ACP methyl ester carboxylesterase